MLAVAPAQAADLQSAASWQPHLGVQVPMQQAFRDEANRPTTLASCARGLPIVLVLAYYGCPNLCSVVLDSLSTSLLRLPTAGQDFAVVVVSIDPRETPAVALVKKRSYIARYARQASRDGLHFLTGDARPLAAAVGFRYAYDASSHQTAHPAGLAVLTPEGRVSGYILGVDYPARALETAIATASSHQTGTTFGSALLRCFHALPFVGLYTVAITHGLQAAGGATVLALAGLLWVLLRRERRTSPAGLQAPAPADARHPQAPTPADALHPEGR